MLLQNAADVALAVAVAAADSQSRQGCCCLGMYVSATAIDLPAYVSWRQQSWQLQVCHHMCQCFC